MATQLLFYEAAVLVSAARHGDWSVEPRDPAAQLAGLARSDGRSKTEHKLAH